MAESEASGSGEPLPLPALLSRLLVAFTIESDNEFEHQMPHRTTRHGSTPGTATSGKGKPPWLVSMPMWVHCLRYVPADGIPVRELVRRSRLSAKSMQTIIKRMSAWWGYLAVAPDPADGRPKPPKRDWLVHPTAAGQQAQQLWEPITGVITGRWRSRFGEQEIAELAGALERVVSQSGTAMPDYLPLGEPRLRPAGDGDDHPDGLAGTLPALLSKALLTFALDFEPVSDLSLGIYTDGGPARLAISAGLLRVLDGDGVRTASLPALTGLARMTVDNWLGALEQHRYLEVGPDPGGSRFKVARLTGRGHAARDTYLRWAAGTGQDWADRFGAEPVHALRAAAARLADGPAPVEPLWRGLEPYPGGWRAQVRPLTELPHYPAVSIRGGFPDGS